MAFSALADKSREPTNDDLRSVLGPSMPLWEELCSSLAAHHQPLDMEWTHAGKNWGWSLRLKRKRRAVTYLTPADGFFYAGFALGDKAVALARQSRLPQSVLDLIDNAKKYAEGRAVRLEIRSRKQLAHVLEIASAKMST